MQRLLAIGTRFGYVKLYGGESIEYTLYHAPSSKSDNGGSQSPITAAGVLLPAAVLHMSFVINEGALITYCDDGALSFWNLRQKQPGILFTKKLINERSPRSAYAGRHESADPIYYSL